MQVLKKEISDKILKVAMDEFYKYGYRPATIRNIAKKANISLGLLYSYYKNKEDLFDDIVKPVYCMVEESLKRPDSPGKPEEDDLLKNEARFLVDLLKEKRKQFLILIDRSEGTKYENAKKMIIEDTCDHIKDRLSKKIINHKQKKIDDVFYHILANNFVEGLLEIARHYKNEKWASKMIDLLSIQYFYGVEGIIK